MNPGVLLVILIMICTMATKAAWFEKHYLNFMISSGYNDSLLQTDESAIVYQGEYPTTVSSELSEEDSPTFPEENIQHKLQMAVAGRKKEKSQPLCLCCSPLILLIAPR